MPIDYTLYPADWKSAIRPRILVRAQNCCEGSPRYPRCRAANGQPHPVTGSGIEQLRDAIRDVIATAGPLAADHPIAINADHNLAALCQRCHLTHDAQQHAINARQTRERRSGQLVLGL